MFIIASNIVYFNIGTITKWKIALLNELRILLLIWSLNGAIYKNHCGRSESSCLSL